MPLAHQQSNRFAVKISNKLFVPYFLNSQVLFTRNHLMKRFSSQLNPDVATSFYDIVLGYRNSKQFCFRQIELAFARV